MATYVISDIHSYYYRFMDLLNQVKWDPAKDELYILGDCLDRGPHPYEMINWMYNQPSTVHFLLGNHDDFLISATKEPAPSLIDGCIRYDAAYEEENLSGDPSIWFWNGGESTYEALMELNPVMRKDFIRWMQRWPLFYDIEINKRRFILVHAGLALNGIRRSDDYYPRGISKDVEIPGFGMQWSQTLLWVRQSWIYDFKKLDCDVISGHTPTSYFFDELEHFVENPDFFSQEKESVITVKGSAESIVHIGYRLSRAEPEIVKHFIDTGRRRMGMMRLDDMVEFYSEIEE